MQRAQPVVMSAGSAVTSTRSKWRSEDGTAPLLSCAWLLAARKKSNVAAHIVGMTLWDLIVYDSSSQLAGRRPDLRFLAGSLALIFQRKT